MEGFGSWRHKWLMWLILISCGIFFFMANILQLDTYIVHQTERYIEEMNTPDLDESLRGFVVKSAGCRIPDMDPFDKSIIRFIRNDTNVKCKETRPPLVESNATSLFIVNSSKEAYGLDNSTDLTCCYKVFSRVDPKNTQSDSSKTAMSKVCVPFVESVNIREEFVQVTCDVGGTIIYTDYFCFVPPKKFKQPTWNQKPLNILIIGIDAVSRLNFIRQMPKTVHNLKKMNAFQFVGFNKVGDNTFPNVIPMLMGRTVEEITGKCWNESSNFGRCDFIWKEYSRRGYVTAIAEDSAHIGMFYYQKKGFQKQPSDYYWTFFNAVAEKAIGNNKELNVNLCLGNRYVYRVMLDYINKFVESLKAYQRSYFAFFWGNSISHDYLNRPKLGDEDYASLLKKLYTEGHLNNTVLVVVSDHGIRWGDIRSTYQGMLEERLPVLFIKLPEWYQRKYPTLANNMRINTRQLVTNFDLYETLKDLADPYEIYHPPTTEPKRGYSLFEKIPENRTCEDAGIVPHWCTCQSSVPIGNNDSMVQSAAQFTVDYINNLLEDFPLCVNLTLDKVFNARLQKHSDVIMKGGTMIEDYIITLRTRPNGALYEVTVRNFHTKDGLQVFKVTGTISRINLYADQSRCISDFRVKLYCFCKEFLN